MPSPSDPHNMKGHLQKERGRERRDAASKRPCGDVGSASLLIRAEERFGTGWDVHSQTNSSQNTEGLEHLQFNMTSRRSEKELHTDTTEDGKMDTRDPSFWKSIYTLPQFIFKSPKIQIYYGGLRVIKTPTVGLQLLTVVHLLLHNSSAPLCPIHEWIRTTTDHP